MGPKKGKDPIDDENYWRMSIEEAPLDEETWKVKVILIEAAGSEQDRFYLDKFETYAREERRFVIKNICRTETIFMVNQLGGEKKVKDDSLRVFEEGQAYLKEKKDIPPEILALIIKHQILKMKVEYLFIREQRLDVRKGMERESTTMISKAEVKGTVNVKLPEPPAVIASAPKGKKGEAEPLSKQFEVDENKKYNTLLRVRGEEWRDKVYIDDYPIDGPNLYVAVTGFLEPYLAGCLVKIGIPLTAIVQILIDLTTTTTPSTLFRATKRGQSQTDVLTEKALKFWEDLQQLRINKYSANSYKNTAFVVFSPPYRNNDNLSGNPEKIYDEVCFLMYDIQDLNRQHINYLENMEIINIPKEYKDNHYINVYENHINEVPLESVTTYLILDSILQAVSEYHNFEQRSGISSLSTAVTFNQIGPNAREVDKLYQSETLVKQFIDKLCLIDSHKKIYRFTYGNECESHKNPVLINYGDFFKYRTFHLGNINIDDIVITMLLGMPINKLWSNIKRPTAEIEAKINFHINVVISCFDRNDVETAELTRLLHILACRKLYKNRSSLKKRHFCPSTISEFKKTYLKRSVLAEPLSKSCMSKCTSSISPLKNMDESAKSSFDGGNETWRIKFLFDFPDISELVSAAEIANEKPINHMIDDFEYFEDFSSTRAFQIILEAFNKFNCVDYKYCEVTDCFIMMFFNSHDKDGVAREEWRCHVPTPLCLQDFFDFVLEEHYDWIRDEEKIYDENIMLRSQSNFKDSKDPQATNTCVEDTDVEMELLMEGSLKYEEITNLDAFSNEISDSKIVLSKKTASILSVADIESKSSKKPKSPANVTPKFVDSGLEASQELPPEKPFLGYDLGNRRVEVFGKDSSYFSKDGSRISSFYSLLIPMNLEYVILNIVSGNGQNEFWMHKAIGESVKPEIIDTCESFRIKTKGNLTMYIKKQVYQIPIPLAHTSSGNVKYRESSAKSHSPDINNILPQLFESKSYHSLFVTWPNGLITESIYDNNSPNISHIKQYYLTPQSHLDEEIRCISLNGEVIIFKCNGNIQILQPSSSCIKITKCEKKMVSDEILEDIQSATSYDKSKKGKETGKGKDKSHKSLSKSSKIALNEYEKEDDQKPLEYKLVMEEYEIIKTNGLKEKWINDSHSNHSINHSQETLLIKSATDYCLGEIFSKRMDGTNIFLNKDGVQIVTFPDKTRIITKFKIEEGEIYPEWTDEEKEYFSMFPFENDGAAIKSKGSISQKSFTEPNIYNNSQTSLQSRKMKLERASKQAPKTDGYISIQVIFIIEHPNFTTITVDKSNDKITIESPNNTTVTFDHDNNYEFILDNRTSAKFDGENLNIMYEACSECKSFTTCDVKIKSEEISSVTQIHRSWVKMKDSFCKKITVNEEGNISVVNETCSVPKFHSKESLCSEEIFYSSEQYENGNKVESSKIAHAKCGQIYETESIKFFILKRDLTCSELVHRDTIEKYKQNCRWKPWCSVDQYDTFGDHRTLWSILTPIHLNETERWLMESKFSDKPKYLAYKDLRKDSGKGFYHWMRPYKRFHPKPIKPDNILPERLPRAFILRTLEQQWREAEREELKGAKELLKAIFRYRHLMESNSETILHVRIHDPRSEYERRTDEIVQAIAHRVYEDLKVRMADDVQTRAKADITTRTPPSPEDMSLKGELDEETTDGLRSFEEDRTSTVKEIESSAEISPTLKRYWRRRAEEFKEEQFYRYLLREGSVPPYFRNVLGGAIWWEIDKAADDAVSYAVRKEMKCVCSDEDQDTITAFTVTPSGTGERRSIIAKSREKSAETLQASGNVVLRVPPARPVSNIKGGVLKRG